MRRVTLCPVIVAFLVAFLVAPFEHVHLPGAAGDSPDSTLVQAHPYVFAVPIRHGVGTGIKDSHVATALSTLQFDLASAPIILFHTETVAILSPPKTQIYDTIETVESCAHDPPVAALSVPRSPPL